MGVEDWDWILGQGPEVTSEKYYSPPYSIRAPRVAWVRGNCKAPGTEYIPNGRIELVYNNNNDTWISYALHFLFRITAPPGTTGYPHDKFYIAEIDPPRSTGLGRFDGGTRVENWSHAIYADIWDQLDPLEWNWFRVTWWSEPGVGLIVRFEVKIGNAWYRICDDFIGFTDMYTNMTYNRVGFIGAKWESGMNPSYIDDIRIYKAV